MKDSVVLQSVLKIMIAWRAVGVLALIGLVGCASSGSVSTPGSPSEAGLYLAVLDDLVRDENAGIAYPRTIRPPERLPGPPAALLNLLDVDSVDFSDLNRAGTALPPEVLPRLNTSQAEVFDTSKQDFFDSAVSMSGDWTAVMKFSAPAYDSNNAALVYCQYSCPGPLCAGGFWIVLNPLEGEWAVVSRKVVWRS